ncbi:multidrug efflux MFS transporter NorA [Oceanobacillus profundus]|uniref:Multidrug efflux MFS transporter NorA n=1 Tax=Oceanobacillus profundus TaxID=372463 RepID=A0A417YBD2_9BACI|nr:multidrug efflux MFS transporter NorA [Oceanobacillus profundus]MBR3118846.1 multidrug efflux MFS transporter NorA [Oceanobacillus sp.]PAE27812.1 MFS transporter [Paenibacillus sp. 7884-2]MCM3400037.1 multidrug efflux MFS transporter NorA [Oceanobacillus profundus]MDO6450879.1 multidrug efflux MFS transporter NorA [Oceanobacillus profundus]RHW29989.1 multidrug efflux MFS transporter NorA [Oceanobacillus profundus]
MKKRKEMTLAILLMNIFFVFLGISLVIPVLPTIMNELNISGTVVGYLTAAFALTQLIFSPFAGKAADKFGRKIMIVIGLFIFSFSELLFGLGKTIEVLFISRILGGVSGAFIMPAVTAFIADVTTIEKRPKALGYMSAAINTGFIIGPGIGGFLAEIGTRVPFFSAAAFAFVVAILSIFTLKEPSSKAEDTLDESPLAGKNSLKKMLKPMFFIAFIVIFIASFGLAAFDSLFSLYVDHKFAFSPSDIAIAITGGAIIGALFQILLFDPLTRYMGEVNIIRWSLLFSTILVFAMTLVNTYWTIMAVTFTVFIGFDLIRPAVTTYLSRIAGNEQGFVGGMNSFFTSLANVFGPVLGGMLFDIDINFPFYFSAVVIILGFVMTMFWKDPHLKGL